MSRHVFSALCVGVGILTLSSPFARGDFVSSFGSGIEGWQVVSFQNLTTDTFTPVATYAPTFHSTGGNPGGYISTTDQDDGDLTFAAPAGFLGNVSGATGLSYDLIYPVGAIDYQPTDVILMGNGLTLLWKSSPNIVPGPSWTSVSLNFVPSTAWHVGTSNGALATAADFASVLGNLSGLFIRGEFTIGLIESPGLDNVRLAGVSAAAVPEPGSFVLLCTGLATVGGFGWMKKRRDRARRS